MCFFPTATLFLRVTWTDTSRIKGEVATKTINYDYLVCAVGAETQTFNIPGVRDHAVFMKELNDAETVCEDKCDSSLKEKIILRLFCVVSRPCY